MLSSHDLVLYKRLDRVERRIELLEQLLDKVSRTGETGRMRLLRLEARTAAALAAR